METKVKHDRVKPSLHMLTSIIVMFLCVLLPAKKRKRQKHFLSRQMKTERKMKKIFRKLLGVVLIGVFIFRAYKLISYKKANIQNYYSLSKLVCLPSAQPSEELADPIPEKSSIPQGNTYYFPEVDFNSLTQINPDILRL